MEIIYIRSHAGGYCTIECICSGSNDLAIGPPTASTHTLINDENEIKSEIKNKI